MENYEFETRNSRRKMLARFLQLVGVVTLLAFFAAVMPEKWIVEIAEELGFDPFPDSTLTFYLARNLSLLYGFVGVLLLAIARDLDRYMPLVRVLAICTVIFGAGQLLVDELAGLPIGWSLVESLSTIAGGLLMGWLERRSR